MLFIRNKAALLSMTTYTGDAMLASTEDKAMNKGQPIRSAVAEALNNGHIYPSAFLERTTDGEHQYYDGTGIPDIWGAACNLPEWKLTELMRDKSESTCQVGLVPVSSEFLAAFFIQRFGRWQHRLLLPLVGSSVKALLRSLTEGASSFEVVFHTEGRDETMACDIHVDEEALQVASSVHVDHVPLGVAQISNALLDVGMLLLEPDAGQAYGESLGSQSIFVSILHYPEMVQRELRIMELLKSGAPS